MPSPPNCRPASQCNSHIFTQSIHFLIQNYAIDTTEMALSVIHDTVHQTQKSKNLPFMFTWTKVTTQISQYFMWQQNSDACSTSFAIKSHLKTQRIVETISAPSQDSSHFAATKNFTPDDTTKHVTQQTAWSNDLNPFTTQGHQITFSTPHSISPYTRTPEQVLRSFTANFCGPSEPESKKRKLRDNDSHCQSEKNERHGNKRRKCA
mmetsp:Transcript_1612/g.5558  ORF Transcript_1612/g.5558 Transcript_1612/m.5558 type:complete len:207 (-) Transcript_1612:1524-2144(-)